MNKSSKKTLSLILVMVLLVCMIPTVASAAGTQELLGSEVTVASGWQYAAQINSTNWGGTFTPDTIKPGSYLTVTFTGENIWGVHLMFKGAAEGQIDHGGDAFTTDADGNYVTTFTYAEMLAINGTEDFSGFNAFMLYTNSGDGVGVTVKSMTFTVPETLSLIHI